VEELNEINERMSKLKDDKIKDTEELNTGESKTFTTEELFGEEPADKAGEDTAKSDEGDDADKAKEGDAEKSETTETADPDDAGKDRKDKKAGKKDKKQDALKEKIAELEDTTKRQLAEFENFRRRTEKEKATMFDMGVKSVVEKILPVVDNFERGLATVPSDDTEKAFADGMSKIYKQLMDELDKIGVKPIEAKGKEFDPNLHNAVMQVASDELESGIVAEELQKGYTYHDTVVRHAMVSVVE